MFLIRSAETSLLNLRVLHGMRQTQVIREDNYTCSRSSVDGNWRDLCLITELKGQEKEQQHFKFHFKFNIHCIYIFKSNTNYNNNSNCNSCKKNLTWTATLALENCEMPNFTYCGLATTVVLFFFSTSVYFLLGIRCRNVDKNTQNNTLTKDSICTNIDSGLANILFIFGCVFMVCGFALLGFIVLIWCAGEKQVDEV